MSNELINKSLDELLYFHFETFSEDYSPVEYDEKITTLMENVIAEIDRNIFNCNSLFATLNYISSTLKRIEVYNNNSFLFYEELEHLFCFNYEYENLQEKVGGDYFEFEVVESNKLRCSKRSLAFRKAYYYYLNVQAFDILSSHLYDILGRYNVNNEIAFDFYSLEEYENYYNLNKLIHITLRQCGNNYPSFLKEFFENQAPVFFIQIKNSYFSRDAKKIKELLKSMSNNPKTIKILRSFAVQIENSKFLDKKIMIEKYYNNENYIKSGIKELLNMCERDGYDYAYNSMDPNLLILMTNKMDFDNFFKDKNVDLTTYEKKREEYINLFKYEIISDFYKLIKKHLDEFDKEILLDKNPEITIQQTSNNKIVNLHELKSGSEDSTIDNKVDDYNIYFKKDGLAKFEKCYIKFKDKKEITAYFSSIYRLMHEKKLFSPFVKNNVFMDFLREYSNKKIDIDQLKTKDNISAHTLGDVLDELKD